MMFKTSQTRVNTWRLCRRKFWYAFVFRIRKKVKARPLKFGSIVHKMLEDDADGKNMFKTLDTIASEQRKMFREERELYGDIIGDTRYIMRAYKEYWKAEPLQLLKVNGAKAEHEFSFAISDEIEVGGRIDGFAKSRKMNWLLEHKSHQQFPNADHRWRNLQSAIYIPIAEQLGWCTQIEGTLWNYVRSKPPTHPQLKQDGTLSERNIDTLPEVLKDSIKQHKLKPIDYANLVAKAESNLSTWFERVYTPLNNDVVSAVWKDFTVTSQEMLELHRKRKERNIGRHCDWCEFEPLCRARLTRGDYDFVMEREYAEKTDSDYEDEVT